MKEEKIEMSEKGFVKNLKAAFRRVARASKKLKSATFLIVLGVGLIVGSCVAAVKCSKDRFRLFEEISAKPEHQELLQNVKDNIELAEKELGIQGKYLSYQDIVENKLLQEGHEDGLRLEECKRDRSTKFLCHIIPGLAAMGGGVIIAYTHLFEEERKKRDRENRLEQSVKDCERL